jgi:hypothetical protein
MENPFFRTMAVTWLLAEGILLLYARWAAGAVRGEEKPQGRFVAACVLLFFLLAGTAFFGETAFRAWHPDSRKIDLFLFNSTLWNLFCTAWVIIEGLIVLYLFRIDRAMKGTGTRPGSMAAAFLLVALPLAFFLLYQAQLVSVVGRYRLGTAAAGRISRFFIRLCGFLWIAFEWAAALVGLRILGRLRREGRTAQ